MKCKYVNALRQSLVLLFCLQLIRALLLLTADYGMLANKLLYGDLTLLFATLLHRWSFMNMCLS